MNEGAAIAARFSYPTSKLRYCGPADAPHEFLEYVKTGRNSDEVRERIKHFEGLYPNLKVIAEANGKDFLDLDVVESYWIGNKLLEKVTTDDLGHILDLLSERGLPKSLCQQLKKELPEGFVPHHDYHVLYVGPGNTAHTVNPAMLSTRDNCRVSWGKVTHVKDETLTVKRQPLFFKNKQYLLGPEETCTVTYDKTMLPEVKAEDTVAIHWESACIVLTPKQLENLIHYSKLVRDVMNKWLLTHEHKLH